MGSDEYNVIVRVERLIKLLTEFIAPVSNAISNICRNHSAEYIAELANGTSWASQMFDSSAKVQTGLQTGNIHSLGNFDECIGVRNITEDFVAQHCLATFRMSTNPTALINGDEMTAMVAKGIKWGFCIPSTCSPQDLAIGLSNYIKSEPDFQVSVGEFACHYQQSLSYSALDMFTISILIAVLLAVVLSTGYELSKDKVVQMRERRTSGSTMQYKHVKIGDLINQEAFRKENEQESNTCRTPEEPEPQTSAYTSPTRSLINAHRNQLTFENLYKLAYISNSTLQKCFDDWQPAELDLNNERGEKLSDIQTKQKFIREYTEKLLLDLKSYTNSLDSGTRSDILVYRGKEGSRTSQKKISPDTEISSVSICSRNSPRASDLQYSEDFTLPSLQRALKQGSLIGPCKGETSEREAFSVQSCLRNGSDCNQIEHDRFEYCVSPTSMDDEYLDPLYRNLKWPSSFSLLSNGRHVFYMDNKDSALQSLYGLKFLSVFWLLIGHSVYIMDCLPSLNYLSFKHNYREWYFMLIQNSSLGIDTFFVVSGVLISYNFLRDMKRLGIQYRKNKPTGITSRFIFAYLPLYYLHHFFRLTPALAIMVLVQASIFNYFGSGPFWYTDNQIMKSSCRQYWWSTLSYLQNYVNGDEMCLEHTWYLMVDMQLYFFSPIILMALLSWPIIWNFLFMSSLLLLGIATSFFVNYSLQLPAGHWNLDVFKWKTKFQYEYITTHTRFGPWIIGLFVGYLLYHWRKSETRRPGDKVEAYPRWMWLLAAMGSFYSVFGAVTFQTKNPENTPMKAAVYSCLFRNVWAMSIGWAIFACETNNGGFVQTLLTWKAFQPLSRLTYCIYLVHLPLLMAKALMTRIPIEKSDIGTISSVCGDIVLSAFIALVLVLCVELPFIRLYEILSYRCFYHVRNNIRPSEKATSLLLQQEVNKDLEQAGPTERTPLLGSSTANCGNDRI